jgi:hypothetical protein
MLSMSENEYSSETDTEEEQCRPGVIRTVHRPSDLMGLGRMAHVHQRRTTVQHDHIRSHHVVVHSRDRTLSREHLFRFQVLFGTADQDCEYTDKCPTELHHKSTPKPLHRRCTIATAYTDVQSLHLTDLLLPHASFIQSITHPIDAIPVVLATPVELLIEMCPNGSHQILGTHPVSNTSNFVCSQVATSNTHSRYKTLNSDYMYDTPVNFFSNITFTVHSAQERLLTHPFEAQNSPDVHAITNLTYISVTTSILVTLQHTPSHIVVGQTVSFRDLGFVLLVDDMTVEQQKWHSLLCTLRSHTFVVLSIEPATKQVVVDGTLLGLPTTSWPVADVSLDTRIIDSLLLNESMQYSFVLRFRCVEKRLQQSTLCGGE